MAHELEKIPNQDWLFMGIKNRFIRNCLPRVCSIFLIIPLFVGCQSTKPSTPDPGPSITELRPLLIAHGFPSVWDGGYSLWKMNESQWDMAFFEEPIPVQDRACYIRDHLVHLFRHEGGFVIRESDSADGIRLSLSNCMTMRSPEYFRLVHYVGWEYGYPTSEEVNDLVTQLYSVLVERNDNTVVVDKMLPGLEDSFRDLKPQDLYDVVITMFGNIHANFVSKALAKSNRNLHVIIKKPLDGVTHVEVSWVQYDVLD